ncbi:MAG: hypothetical protein ACRDT0_06510 [Pseudonocardiaceae bacterium]
MTSVTSKRRRRLALMAAGTAAAMVLLPATASAQPDNPVDDVVAPFNEVAESINGGAPAGLPNIGGPAAPAPLVDLGTPTQDDDSPGHETNDPLFPDHGAGEVGNVELGKEDQGTNLLDVTKYDATVNDDNSSKADVTVIGLLGNELIGSHANSGGTTEQRENFTGALCEGTNGGLCLSLLYSEAFAQEKTSLGRGGLLALCLGGNDKTAVASYDCSDVAPVALGVAEGIGVTDRDHKGDTVAASGNKLADLCLGTKNPADDICKGLGVQALPSSSISQAEGGQGQTKRDSYLLGFDASGNRTEILSDPAQLTIPPGCGGPQDNGPALLCLFFNQGESFIFPGGAASAQEALHLDLLRNTPLAILVELGKAESLARTIKDEKKPPEDGKEPPKDGKDKDEDGLAVTGSDIAPLLAGAFALIGLGALTVAGTRRHMGKHTA